MRIGDWIILLSCVGMVIYVGHKTLEDRHEQQAFKECLEEVSNKCSASIGYAIALEEENAKLNKKLRECRNEGR